MRYARLLPAFALVGTLLGVAAPAHAAGIPLFEDEECTYYIDFILGGFIPVPVISAECVSIDVSFEEVVE